MPLHDEADHYFADLLEAALKVADGKHTLTTVNLRVPQSRVLRTVMDGSGDMNVFYTGHSIEREQLLHQIDIPLTRGLIGHRIFAIHAADAPLFHNITTLEQLTQNVSMGSGTSWPDTLILKAAGFAVKTGTFENLWPMLARRRFTAFPRGMYEIHDELKEYGDQLPGAKLTTEKTLMISYKFDQFFYVAPHDQERGAIIKQGLLRIYENGEFMRIFHGNSEIKEALEEIRKNNRYIIRLENPLNSDRVNAIPTHFWHSLTDN